MKWLQSNNLKKAEIRKDITATDSVKAVTEAKKIQGEGLDEASAIVDARIAGGGPIAPLGDTYKFYLNDSMIHETIVPVDHQDREWYVILNLAIGGNWPGNPNAETGDKVEMGVRSLSFGELRNGNSDVIKRIETMRDESMQCIKDAAQRQIDVLI